MKKLYSILAASLFLIPSTATEVKAATVDALADAYVGTLTVKNADNEDISTGEQFTAYVAYTDNSSVCEVYLVGITYLNADKVVASYGDIYLTDVAYSTSGDTQTLTDNGFTYHADGQTGSSVISLSGSIDLNASPKKLTFTATINSDDSSTSLPKYLSFEGNYSTQVPTGATVATAESDAPQYYNLLGMKVENPSGGVYIVKQNGHTSKVYME